MSPINVCRTVCRYVYFIWILLLDIFLSFIFFPLLCLRPRSRLGDMRFLFEKHFSSSLQTRIFQQIAFSLESVNSIGLGSVLKGLAGMEYEWSHSKIMEKSIFKSVTDHYHPVKRNEQLSYNAQGIANCIYYLGELSKISEKAGKKMVLNQEVLDSLRNGVERCCHDFKPEFVPGLVRGYIDLVYLLMFFLFFFFLILTRLVHLNIKWEITPPSVEDFFNRHFP
jgi:hypothetical protein